jgi:hypothetical protein
MLARQFSHASTFAKEQLKRHGEMHIQMDHLPGRLQCEGGKVRGEVPTPTQIGLFEIRKSATVDSRLKRSKEN